MSLISLSFFIFVAVLACIYYTVPTKFRWCVLLVGNITFYLLVSTPILLVCTILMVCIAYFATRYEGKRKQWIIRSAITIELLIWIVFQANIFFVNNTNNILRLIGSDSIIPVPSWAAPLGISYYALILVGYILDVYWGKILAQNNPLKLALFVTFFPQMITGPITRYDEMSEQLFLGQRFSGQNIVFGTQRILWGLFKKLVIAERLGDMVALVYDNYTVYPGFVIVLGMFAYTLQLYCDFSASMDIVIGVGQIFGIMLPENFRTPFFSTNLSELWRRWHMTLGFWVKDYVLYPVLKSVLVQRIGKYNKKKYGKKLGKQISTYIGLLATWSFVGFWHGGSWKYIFGSGLCFFVIIVGGIVLEPVFVWCKKMFSIRTECFSYRLFQSIRTFVLFSISIGLTRASGLKTGINMIKYIVTNFFSGLSSFSMVNLVYGAEGDGISFVDLIELVVDYGVILGICLLVLFIISSLQQKYSIRSTVSTQNLPFRWAVWFVLIFTIIILGHYGPGYSASEFIYGGF